MTSKKKTMNAIAFILTLLSMFFIFYGVKEGLFKSEEAMNEFLKGFGLYAPIIFIVIQAIQVVFPVMPFAIGCVVGILFFGPWWGFLYNYIGICTGSIIAFFIARRYGRPILSSFFGEKTIEKYINKTDNDKFNTYFALAIFFPLAPDDFLCYLAGTTAMKPLFFIAVILLGKPFSLAAYSFGLNSIFKYIFVLR